MSTWSVEFRLLPSGKLKEVSKGTARQSRRADEGLPFVLGATREARADTLTKQIWLCGFLRFRAENRVFGAAADRNNLACCDSGFAPPPVKLT